MSPLSPPELSCSLAAFAAVYLLWGSTYLAIKYAIVTMPPFLMAGSRFLAGGQHFGAGRPASADYETPTLAQWKTSFVVGALLLWAATAWSYWPSAAALSLAALLIASEPFWVVCLGWWWLRQPRPSGQVVLGLLLGFGGVYLLVGEQLTGGQATRSS